MKFPFSEIKNHFHDMRQFTYTSSNISCHFWRTTYAILIGKCLIITEMTSSCSRFACQFSAVKSFKQLLTCFSLILQLLTFSFLLSVLRFLSCRYFAFALQSSCIIWFQDVTNTWLFGTTMCRAVVFIQVVGKFLRLQSNFSTI